MKGIGGWLLVYLAGSVPVTLFFAAGLAGRFFDYHWGAVAGIFLVLAVPHNILIKHCAGKTMQDSDRYLRIASRTGAENCKLAEALAAIIDSPAKATNVDG
jgi:hypothetical protein